MIKSLFLVCIFFQYSWLLQAQKNKSSSPKATPSQAVEKSYKDDIAIIKKQINEREQARLNGDKSIGQRVLASDYISIDETGTMTPKSTSFDNPIDTAVWRQMRETNSELQMKISVDSFQFRFYDKAAIVNYRLYYDLVFNNEPCHKVFQCNEVLMKQNGNNWQSVSHTETVIPGKPYARKIDTKVYHDYVGTYRLFSKKNYTIIQRGDTLILGTRQNIELIPEDETTFVENGLNYYRIKFIRNASGKVIEMRWIEYPGVEYSAIKTK